MSLLQSFGKNYTTTEHTSTLVKFNVKFKLAKACNPNDIDFDALNLNQESKVMLPQTLASYQHSNNQTKHRTERDEMLKSARFLNKSLSDSSEILDERASRSLRQSDDKNRRDRSRSPNSRKS